MCTQNDYKSIYTMASAMSWKRDQLKRVFFEQKSESHFFTNVIFKFVGC